MEELLHYVWKHKLFPLHQLQTTNHKEIEILDIGLPNTNAGPDFFNAKIKIDNTVWVGNVEIHLKASDWYKHNHQFDKAYDSTILHVVGESDGVVTRTNGEEILQLELPISDDLISRYAFLKQADYQPKCFSILGDLDKFSVHSWLSTLQVERLEQKYNRIMELYNTQLYYWSDILFITLARNFGFGLNGDTFERWAKILPFRAMDKHRDSQFQIEAILFGMSGLLESETSDAYTENLQSEFHYLKTKFNLSTVDLPWKLARTRPGNFPHIRIAQLAHFYHGSTEFVNAVLKVDNIKSLYAVLSFGTSEYWDNHYHFNSTLNKRNSVDITEKTKDLLLINTIIPFLYAYGKYTLDEAIMDRALELLQQIKAENNYIIRLWQSVGVEVNSAADSQGVIQLQKEYCDKKKCFYCRFGYRYFARTS